jgi:hypothetical protein
MAIFTRQVPARVKVRRLVLLFTVHWARDFTTGATTTLLMSVRSMLMMLSSALLAREVFVANTGVVNDCVSPTDVPTALVAPSRQ